MSPNVPLTRNQRRAISALLLNSTLEGAAESIHVSRKTLQRWLSQPGFATALQVEELEVIAAASRRLLVGQGQALGTLESIIGSGSKDSDRRLASVAWLDLTLRVHEMRILDQKIRELEERLDELTNQIGKDRATS
jgi:hypothetical protein